MNQVLSAWPSEGAVAMHESIQRAVLALAALALSAPVVAQPLPDPASGQVGLDV